MSDDPTKESAPTEPAPVETTGSESVTAPSLPLESSATVETHSLANNDNQEVLSENNLIIPTESEKPIENQARNRENTRKP